MLKNFKIIEYELDAYNLNLLCANKLNLALPFNVYTRTHAHTHTRTLAKTKLSLSSALMTLLLAVTITGCEKDSELEGLLPTDGSTPTLTSRDGTVPMPAVSSGGWLVFTDTTHAKNFYFQQAATFDNAVVVEGTEDTRDGLLNLSLLDPDVSFNSLLALQSAQAALNGNDEIPGHLDISTDDEIMLSLLSESAAVQVGDSVHFYRNAYETYSVHKLNTDGIDVLLNTKPGHSVSDEALVGIRMNLESDIRGFGDNSPSTSPASAPLACELRQSVRGFNCNQPNALVVEHIITFGGLAANFAGIINWGDGSTSSFNTNGSTVTSHTYAVPGRYRITTDGVSDCGGRRIRETLDRTLAVGDAVCRVKRERLTINLTDNGPENSTFLGVFSSTITRWTRSTLVKRTRIDNFISFPGQNNTWNPSNTNLNSTMDFRDRDCGGRISNIQEGGLMRSTVTIRHFGWSRAKYWLSNIPTATVDVNEQPEFGYGGVLTHIHCN